MSGIDYSLTSEFTTRPGVTRSALISALKPLAESLWFPDDWDTAIPATACSSGLEIKPNKDGSFDVDMYFDGEGSHSAYQSLTEVAQALTPLVDNAGFFEFRDHSTGDLENAVTREWFGPNIAQAQREFTIMEVKFKLKEIGFSDEDCNRVEADLKAIVSTIDQREQNLAVRAAPRG